MCNDDFDDDRMKKSAEKRILFIEIFTRMSIMRSCLCTHGSNQMQRMIIHNNVDHMIVVIKTKLPTSGRWIRIGSATTTAHCVICHLKHLSEFEMSAFISCACAKNTHFTFHNFSFSILCFFHCRWHSNWNVCGDKRIHVVCLFRIIISAAKMVFSLNR